MTEHNYHLQYMIYALALKKYLEVRLNGFDYEQHFGGVIYLFIRGLRSGERTGVFCYRPNFSEINHLAAVRQMTDPDSEQAIPLIS